MIWFILYLVAQAVFAATLINKFEDEAYDPTPFEMGLMFVLYWHIMAIVIYLEGDEL